MALAIVQDYPSAGIADDAGVIRTHLKHVLAKRDGVWRILSAQNTFITTTLASPTLGQPRGSANAAWCTAPRIGVVWRSEFDKIVARNDADSPTTTSP